MFGNLQIPWRSRNAYLGMGSKSLLNQATIQQHPTGVSKSPKAPMGSHRYTNQSLARSSAWTNSGNSQKWSELGFGWAFLRQIQGSAGFEACHVLKQWPWNISFNGFSVIEKWYCASSLSLSPSPSPGVQHLAEGEPRTAWQFNARAQLLGVSYHQAKQQVTLKSLLLYKVLKRRQSRRESELRVH